MRFMLIILFAFLCYAAPAAGDILLKDNFNTMNNWRALTFPKIKKHTTYSIKKLNTGKVLLAVTNGGASGLLLKNTFSVYKYPIIRWRWRVSNIYKDGNATIKKKDDFPARIYIVFADDHSRAGFFKRALYSTARLVYGKYPPEAALNYIWANRRHSAKMLVSPYTRRSIMIPLEQGPRFAGQWREERVNIVRDYYAAFKKHPPKIASIIIMSDGDNTGDSATAEFDFVEIAGE